MALVKTNFSASNPNFWARLLIFVLAIAARFGIQFPSSPEVLGPDIVTTLTGGSLYAIITILAISVIMPVVNFIRAPSGIKLWDVISSPNTWVYVLTFLLGLLVMKGVPIPDGTAEALVGAAYAKDWAALFTIAGANVIDPFVRWLRDRRNKAAAMAR